MRWIIGMGVLGLATAWLIVAQLAVAQATCAAAPGRGSSLVVVLDAGPAMDAPSTPFSTRRHDAELLLAALHERLLPEPPPAIVRYNASPQQTFAAALGTAARSPAAQPAIILIGAGMPAGPAAHAVAPDHPTLVLDLADDAALAAWAGRHGARYVPMAATRTQAFAARLAALDTALRRFVPTAAPSGCLPLPDPAALTKTPAAWWAIGLSSGGILAILVRRLPRTRQLVALPPPPAELRTASLHTPANRTDTSPDDSAPGLHQAQSRIEPGQVRRAWRHHGHRGRIVTVRGRASPTAAAAPTPGSAALRPGVRLGGCLILRELGSGGQGCSYLAFGPGARRVVLKVAHPGAEAALYNEHAWLSRPTARHPHLARLAFGGEQATLGVNAGRVGARLTWLALAYIPGRPLSDWMERRALTLDQSLTIALQAAQALDHLYRATGSVHQDVAPANLIVRRRWNGAIHTTLIDLGSAAAWGARQRTAGGTEPYVAPERLSDPTAPPDPLSDIFALGVVLGRLTAGRALPSELADLITAMTLPDPTQRRAAVPTWQAVIVRLEGIRRGEGVVRA